MPFLIARKLNLGEITPTSLSLQMTDRLMTFPKRIIEDVLVKIEKFIFPVDFVVLDMEEDQEAPLILKRQFLATGQALIDVKNGELTLRVGEDQVKFNLYKSMEFQNDVNVSCMRIDTLIPSQVELLHAFGKRDSIEQCLKKSLTTTEMDFEDLSLSPKLIETIMAFDVNDGEAIFEEKKTSKVLVLKELPKGLKYAFLGKVISLKLIYF